MTARLPPEEIERALHDLPGWERQRGAIRKAYVLDSFADAVAFAVRVAMEADRVDHHPDIAISARRVSLGYTTHSVGGLTSKDIEGALFAESLAGRWRQGA